MTVAELVAAGGVGAVGAGQACAGGGVIAVARAAVAVVDARGAGVGALVGGAGNAPEAVRSGVVVGRAARTRQSLLEHVLFCPEGPRRTGVAEQRLGVPLKPSVADAVSDSAAAVAAKGCRKRGALCALPGAGGVGERIDCSEAALARCSRASELPQGARVAVVGDAFEAKAACAVA